MQVISTTKLFAVLVIVAAVAVVIIVAESASGSGERLSSPAQNYNAACLTHSASGCELIR